MDRETCIRPWRLILVFSPQKRKIECNSYLYPPGIPWSRPRWMFIAGRSRPGACGGFIENRCVVICFEKNWSGVCAGCVIAPCMIASTPDPEARLFTWYISTGLLIPWEIKTKPTNWIQLLSTQFTFHTSGINKNKPDMLVRLCMLNITRLVYVTLITRSGHVGKGGWPGMEVGPKGGGSAKRRGGSPRQWLHVLTLKGRPGWQAAPAWAQKLPYRTQGHCVRFLKVGTSKCQKTRNHSVTKSKRCRRKAVGSIRSGVGVITYSLTSEDTVTGLSVNFFILHSATQQSNWPKRDLKIECQIPWPSQQFVPEWFFSFKDLTSAGIKPSSISFGMLAFILTCLPVNLFLVPSHAATEAWRDVSETYRPSIHQIPESIRTAEELLCQVWAVETRWRLCVAKQRPQFSLSLETAALPSSAGSGCAAVLLLNCDIASTWCERQSAPFVHSLFHLLETTNRFSFCCSGENVKLSLLPFVPQETSAHILSWKGQLFHWKTASKIYMHLEQGLVARTKVHHSWTKTQMGPVHFPNISHRWEQGAECGFSIGSCVGR